MKKMKKFLPLISLAALMACSSMDVSESESVAENYPDDFDVNVYMELHPELRSLQIQDYVSNYNDALDTNVYTDDVITEDSTTFLADTALLHVIFTTPEYAGYSEDIWEEDWMSISVTTVDTVITPTLFDTVSVKLDSMDTDADTVVSVLTVYYPTFDLDEETNSVGTVSGYSDSDTTTAEAISYEADSVSIIILWKYITRDTLEYDTTITETEEITEGSLTKAHRTLLKKFNFYDTTDDLASLETVPWDTAAFSYQFIVFGKSHGWAYRYCTDDEASNTIRGSDVYPASTYYCEDEDGIVREITE